jgi:hypothetical protein
VRARIPPPFAEIVRLDVLIESKQARRIVPALDPDETIEVSAIALPHAVLTIVHHEVDIRASR